MSDLDRIETNFRLSLMSQREQTVLLNDVASSLAGQAHQMAGMASQMSELANQTTALANQTADLAKKVGEVAEKSDQTAERLEDSIQVMKSFAESQVEIRKILAEYGRRLDALEEKHAS